MAENLVENQVCENCGADVRLNALFCFNCGSQVASDEAVAAENQNEKKVSDAWFKETIAAEQMGEIPILTKKKATAIAEKEDIQAKPKPSEALKTESSTDETATKIEATKTEPLKTAASLRNRPKPTLKKTVEVTWDSHENAPNVWFLLVALILTLFAVGILYAMLYVR